MLAKSVHGKADVEAAVGLAHEIQSDSFYTSIIATSDLLVELFDCAAEGYPIEGLWVQKLNKQGQIYDLTVYLRPRSPQRLSALFPRGVATEVNRG